MDMREMMTRFMRVHELSDKIETLLKNRQHHQYQVDLVVNKLRESLIGHFDKLIEELIR